MRSAPRYIKKCDSTVLFDRDFTPSGMVLLRNCSDIGHKAMPKGYGFAAFFYSLFSERM
nr:MAG TPA: hypothetical protein [Caudoviricetes sp.]